MAYKIQLRKGTATEWSTANPILSSGEIGVDLTNSELRVGNGTDTWSSLSPIGAGGGAIDASSVSILDSLGFYTSESVEGALTEIAQILTEYNANLIPDTDATYDLGSIDNQWNNAYIADSVLVGDILLSDNVITPLGGNTEYDDKAKIIVDGDLLVNGEISKSSDVENKILVRVGPNQEFTSIVSAMTYLEKLNYLQSDISEKSITLSGFSIFPTDNTRAYIQLMPDYILNERIVLKNKDYSWITITTYAFDDNVDIDSFVPADYIYMNFDHLNTITVQNPIDVSYLMLNEYSPTSYFLATNGAKLPQLYGCLFDFSGVTYPTALCVAVDYGSYVYANTVKVINFNYGTLYEVNSGASINLIYTRSYSITYDNTTFLGAKRAGFLNIDDTHAYDFYTGINLDQCASTSFRSFRSLRANGYTFQGRGAVIYNSNIIMYDCTFNGGSSGVELYGCNVTLDINTSSNSSGAYIAQTFGKIRIESRYSNIGARIRSGSVVDLTNGYAPDCTEYGLYIDGFSRVNAAGFRAQKGATPSSSDIYVEGGATVYLDGASTGGYNLTPNVQTIEGLILDTKAS